MTVSSTTAIPKGSTVLITGVSGLVGSAVADYFLKEGFKVRGTLRSLKSTPWVKQYFDEHYPRQLELVEIADITAENAYDEVTKDASAFIHIAYATALHSDPTQVIPYNIKGALTAIKAAYAAPSVKRFVLTSTCLAAYPLPGPGEDKVRVVDHDSWNEVDVKAAWAKPPYTMERGNRIYAAGKIQSEKEVWKYHKDNQAKRPDLVVNSILPGIVMGIVVAASRRGYPSTSGYLKAMVDGHSTPVGEILGNQYHTDTEDTGALHYAAAVLPDVKSERIFALFEPFDWNDILVILRKMYPNRSFPEKVPATGLHHDIKGRSRAIQLLKRIGRPGYVSIEESIRRLAESGNPPREGATLGE